ncbi:MAG TPA: HAD family phosphatase [Treponemataceae bacterium]|nr:HAD family phosphatase [Treponemataceae bacterium]
MKAKALVLDYGNVISESHDETCYGRMAALAGLSEGFFREGFWRYRPAYDRGELRGVELWARVLADAGVSADRALLEALVREDVGSWRRVSDAVTRWALDIQAAGFRLGILSNMPVDFLEVYGHTVELFKRADFALFSCELGLVKPESAIYRACVERSGFMPGEIVFFDDMEANVRSAREAGIDAYRWVGLDRARVDWDAAIRGE